MCRIIVELHLLWRLRNKFRPINLPENDPGTVEAWLPWQHIYPWPKGHATPTYNPQGKYCVKVYWMVRQRKSHTPLQETIIIINNNNNNYYYYY